MSEQLLVSKRDAAAMLGLCVRTVEKLISLKELPSRRIGRRRLIEKTALERFARRDHQTQQERKNDNTVQNA
jgi:excisionase family DNA binding protein